MKKLLLVLALGFLSLGSFAQPKGKDHITMKSDGKMYWIRSGQPIRMGIYVPLKNGDFAYPDGSVKSKDGAVSKLAQGDKILMDGTVIPGKKRKQPKQD